MEVSYRKVLGVFFALIAGLSFALMLELLAVLMSGAGDGWNGAARLGIWALVACPLLAVSLLGRTGGYRMLAGLALLVGIVIDFKLIESIREEYQYFQKVYEFGIVWMLSMLAWQLLALWALLRGLPGAQSSEISEHSLEK